MKELIKEAESLYLELSRITDSLIYARLHDDKDLLHGCRNELENFAQSVMQTLKCLVDRKDNIVDLGEVWHDKIIKPDENSKIVVISESEEWYNISYAYDDYDDSFGNGWESCVRLYDIVKWAYVEDLLPKGDNK